MVTLLEAERNIPRAHWQTKVSIIWLRVESEMLRLQPVRVGVGVRVVTAHGRRCDSWWFLSGRGGAGLRG